MKRTKLRIHRETLRQLGDRDLRPVRGAAINESTHEPNYSLIVGCPEFTERRYCNTDNQWCGSAPGSGPC